MGFTYYYARIRPMVADLARQRSAQMITVAINKVINEEMEANPVGYDELMQIQTGDDGRIQALYANTKEMNKLKSTIARQGTGGNYAPRQGRGYDSVWRVAGQPVILGYGADDSRPARANGLRTGRL